MKSDKERELIEAINSRLTQVDRWELSVNGKELTDNYLRVKFELIWDYDDYPYLAWEGNTLIVNPSKLRDLVRALSIKERGDKLHNLYLIYNIGG